MALALHRAIENCTLVIVAFVVQIGIDLVAEN